MGKFTKFELMDQNIYTRFRRGEGIVAIASIGAIVENELYHVAECFYDHEFHCEFVKLVEIGPDKLFTLEYFEPVEPSYGMTISSKIESLIAFEQGLDG
tara:strand:+ start:3083 stop:3379 length:297 start_codon:yes stop_codon:yes gene_type:complete